MLLLCHHLHPFLHITNARPLQAHPFVILLMEAKEKQGWGAEYRLCAII
jgi:hypothetical protein